MNVSFRTLLIGRIREANLRLSHSTVSRRHAEITVTESGRCYLIDRGSTRGTFRRETDGRWKRHRCGFVGLAMPVRFGSLETTVGKLLGGPVSKLFAAHPMRSEYESVSIRPRLNMATGKPARVRDA